VGVPAVVFLLVAAVLAQPTLMALFAARLELPLAQQRTFLAHQHASSALGEPESRAQQLAAESTRLTSRIERNRSELNAIAAEGDTRAIIDRRAALSEELEDLKRQLASAAAHLQATHAHIARLRKEEIEPYVANLSSSPFPVFCISTLWEEPASALACTLLFMVLVSSPVLMRGLMPSDIRRYELQRRISEREQVIQAHRNTAKLSRQWLGAHMEQVALIPTKTRVPAIDVQGERFSDAPFNRMPLASDYASAVATTQAELLAAIKREGDS
jgi:hypothetical protein